MKWNRWVRQTHRWLSIVFTLFVLVNIGLNILAVAPEDVVLGVGVLTLVPLFLLMITGLYLFALPYAARGRNEQTTPD